MNSTKIIVLSIPVLLLMLVLGLLYSIRPTNIELSCDLPSTAGQSPSLDELPEPINISLNIDGSESMPGYLANGRSRYVKTIELLERTFSISDSSVEYYRVGGPEKQNINGSKFIEAKKETFYRQDRVTSNLAAAIVPQKEGKELLVLISDLYQNQGDVTALNQKIREHYLNQEGYAAGILAIRSEFNGTVYVVGSNRDDFEFPYDTEGKSIDEFRPFYVIFLGPYEQILYYFNKLKRDGEELMKNSEFTIFSPSNTINTLPIIPELANPDETIPGLRQPFSLNNGKVAIEVENQPIELLEITRNFQKEIPINYKVSLPILNEYTLPPSNNSIQAKISESKYFDESTKELISSSKEATIERKLLNSMQLSNWKVGSDRELSFTTTIKPNEFPQANIYFFQVDVVANGLGEQDWWQNWNCEDLDCENDGSKTHNLEHFLLGLKSITTDLMKSNPIKLARLCYAIQKN